MRGALRVFLSHTSELRELPSDRSFVAAAESAVMRAGHAVTDMAYFAARDSAPADTCVAELLRAQVYVGIIGCRYGAPVRERPQVSYTQLEFETATKLGLPRLIFLVRESTPAILPIEAPELTERQRTFRRRLQEQEGVTVAWVSSPEDLQIRLHQALVEVSSMREATAAATRTLPRDVATFTGRETELEHIVAAVSDTEHARSAVVISAIDGMAGVGKTAFAIHAAWRMAPQFPDGQLYLDLHTHTPGHRPTTPNDALGTLLLTLGVAPHAIPPDLDRRAALWRDRLSGERVLILLDDAASSEQVQSLLPSTSGSVVLITSRRRLAALEDVDSITLNPLPPVQSLQLFARLIGTHDDESDKQGIIELAELCGHLPLAIRLLAGRLRSRPTWTARDLVRTLENAHDLLAEMSAENIAVDAAFELSYRSLLPDRKRLFRRLGMHPGRDIDAYTAAVLDMSDLQTTRRRLETLYNDHLIDEPLPGRYRLHDLIRRYARTLVAKDNPARNESALDRLFDYYVHTTSFANQQLGTTSLTAGAVVDDHFGKPDLSTRQAALVWFESEWANVIECLDRDAARDRPRATIMITHSMHSFLRTAGHWSHAIAANQLALAAASSVEDLAARAQVLNDLGDVQRLADQCAAAMTSLVESVSLYRKMGDECGEATASWNLGIAQYHIGDYPTATTSLTHALSLFDGIGHRVGQASALTTLGVVQCMMGELGSATESLTQAVALTRDLDDRHRQARALVYLGTVQERAGNLDAATESATAALSILRQLGDRLGEAEALVDLGAVQRRSGEHEAASTSLRGALSIFDDMHDRFGQAGVLNHLGTLFFDRSEYDKAVTHHQRALHLAQETAFPLEAAHALVGIGLCLARTLEVEAGISRLQQALLIYQRLGVPEAGRVRAILADIEGSGGATG